MRCSLCRALESAGYQVTEVASLLHHRDLATNLPPVQLVILETNEPGSLAAAKKLRREFDIPFVIIAERGEPDARLEGLVQGAEDYIVKPFDVREVILRVGAVLRRSSLERALRANLGMPLYGDGNGEGATRDAAERYCFEGGVVDARRRDAKLSASGLPLTDAEFDILLLFLLNPNRVLSRDEIMLKLRGRPWSPTERTIDGHIARLRKKLDPTSRARHLIKTVWGTGYLFSGEVRRLS